MTPDGANHPGQPYGSTWAGAPVGPAGGPIPSDTIGAQAGRPLHVVVDGDTCAVDWSIAYSALPPAGGAPWKFTPIAELVPTVSENRDPAYASQNRFVLAPVPAGVWLVAVEFTFAGGQELTWWRVALT